MTEAQKIAGKIISCFRRGNSVYICGNGGSATQSSHFAAEFVNKYIKDRQPLPAYSLNDLATITSIANDRGYEYIFSRQIEAYGKKGDILISLSTSGKSLNVLNAMTQANKQGMVNIEFPRKGNNTGEIQNYHVALMHEICKVVEEAF